MKRRALSTLVIFAVFITAGIFLFKHLMVDMYNTSGEEIKVLRFNTEDYKKEGWYETPVTVVYAPDNESKVIQTSELEAYKKDGWYKEPVTRLYNASGEEKTVYTSEVENSISDGWYTEPVALMTNENNPDGEYIPVSQITAKRKDGWFIKEFCSGLPELLKQIKEYTGNDADKIGIHIKNMNTGDTLTLNDGSHRSASVIKLFQLATLYSEIEKNNLKNDDSIHEYMDPMITISDNFSSNHVVNIIGNGNYKYGFDTENNFAKSIDCYATQHLSLFLDGGYFTSFGSNRTSPYDCGLLLEKIYNCDLFSKEYCDEMLALLKQQTRREKIPYFLPEDTVIANKTGEAEGMQHDVGIVYSPNCDYIICVFTTDLSDGTEKVQQISRITYEYFN